MDNKSVNTNENKANKKTKSKKRNFFQYPENWKAELDELVDIKYVIPNFPKKEDILEKPDINTLINSQKFINNQITKIKKKIEDEKEKRKEIQLRESKINKTVIDKLKDLRNIMKDIDEKIKDQNQKKDEVNEKIQNLEEKKKEIAKKFPNGEIKEMKKLKIELTKIEYKMKNSNLNSREEKSLYSQMKTLHSSTKLFGELDKIKDERENLKKLQDPIFTQIKKLREEKKTIIDKLKNLESQLTFKKQSKENKKEFVKTKEEQEIDCNINNLYQELKKFNNKIKLENENFNSKKLDYEKQQFEIKKINYMIKRQKNLKYEEQKLKQLEEKEKQKENEKSILIKNFKDKYSDKINICNNLILVLTHYKNRNTFNNKPSKINDIDDLVENTEERKKEGLIAVVPKTKDSKQKPEKKHKKNKLKKIVKDDEGELIDTESMKNLTILNINVPDSIDQIDETISKINNKKTQIEAECEVETNKYIESLQIEKPVSRKSSRKYSERVNNN